MENTETNGDEKSLWWVGAIIYIVGSILVNLGSNIVRRDHFNHEKLPPKALYTRPLWAFGSNTFSSIFFPNFINMWKFKF